MNVAIVGSRDYPQDSLIQIVVERLLELHGADLTIISGGARGADTWAYEAAHRLHVPLKVYLPDWDRHGKSAGFRRNELIVADADMLIAFFTWGTRSRGTSHSVNLALAKPIPVHVWDEEIWTRA